MYDTYRNKKRHGGKYLIIPQSENSNILNVTEEMSTTKQWLKFHTEPIEEVKLKWKSCFALRRSEVLSSSKNDVNLCNLFKEWPLFSRADAKLYVS